MYLLIAIPVGFAIKRNHLSLQHAANSTKDEGSKGN